MPNSFLLVAGAFTSPNRITRWNGSNFLLLGTGAGGLARTVTRWQKNTVIGGAFTTVDGVSAARIAKHDGTVWTALGSGLTGGDCLHVSTFGDDLIAVGDFTAAGSTSADFVARWDDTAWNLMGSATDFKVTVRQAIVHQNELYVCGGFQLANPSPSDFISKWDGVGAWLDLVTQVNSSVLTMVTDNLGNLIFGGQFTSAGGVTATRLGSFDGTTWGALDSGGTGANGDVLAMTAFDSKIAIGGNFTTLGGDAHTRVGLWNPGTASFEALGTGFNAECRGLKTWKGELYAAGDFTTADGNTANRIARWNKNTEVWTQVGPSGLADDAYSLAIEAVPPAGGASAALADTEGSAFERDVDDIRISLQGFHVYFQEIGFDIPFRTNVHTLDGIRRSLDGMHQGILKNGILVDINPNIHSLRQARAVIDRIRRELEVQ